MAFSVYSSRVFGRRVGETLVGQIQELSEHGLEAVIASNP